MDKILSIDPSGTGTTGIYFTNGSEQEFFQFTNAYWKEHYFYLKALAKEKKVNKIVFENTNFINNRSKDSLNLIRLLGAIETLPIKQVQSINVLKVKELSKALFAGKANIPNLQYLPGRGKG
ncbi:hypothetical protein L211DRAFT_883839 [Terfezia boudieri ATCC MYA-4762]|uniref:Uncharacterized protein n=1 Tax=Terfezia boudieri ATCC MYA-4762 TaxID=1051890 RepID=A0A3N4L626_9PEZI|nr:hypothetical protein L211DRAFT_883839 [Terfezia boudieri ATCC MYA-4762]